MREMFEQKLTKLISKKKDNSTFLSSDQYKNRIEAVKEAKDILSSSKGKMKLPMHYWLSERFDIINDGVELEATVRLSISNVDRSRESPNNILAMTKSVDEDLYTLCSEHGQFKHKYLRAEIHLCSEKLLDLAAVTAKADNI
ncbi:hypothetical protein M0804_013708 [Polistes exclamans]|nr:hypothetical protein M0804_013708 [Polistes exclamans]